ncbi:hypothetical protein Tco_1202567 [Tanacetum coccineum]
MTATTAWRCHACDGFLVLEDEDADSEEEEFEEEEESQEEEDDDMEVDIEEDENEPELTYLYEEVDPLNPSPPASESEPEDVSGLRKIESEDKTVPASVHEVDDCGREMAHALVEKKGKAKDKYYGKLILDLGNKVRSSMEQGTTAMEKLVERLGNAKDKVECKKLMKELEKERLSNTFIRTQNERVERDLYWTIGRAHEFYQEMIRKGFMFEERLNEAIDILIKDEKSPTSEPIMPPKSAPLTQAAIRRMIKESVDVAIAAERARHANVRNDARGSGPARGQDAAPAAHECTFAGFMKCNPTGFHGTEGAVELLRWFEKTESVFGINECAEGKKVKFDAATLQGPALTWWNAKVAIMGLETVNQMPWTEMKQLMTVEFNELALMCPRMVETERVKVDAYIRGLTDNIKGKVTSSKPANLNEAVRMAHKLMEQTSQAIDEIILEGKIQKWESFQSRNSSGKGNHRDNSDHFLCVNVVLLAMFVSVHCSSSATSGNGWPQMSLLGAMPQGKVKQEEVGEVCGRAYAIKDAEPKGPNVVTCTFLTQ